MNDGRESIHSLSHRVAHKSSPGGAVVGATVIIVLPVCLRTLSATPIDDDALIVVGGIERSNNKRHLPMYKLIMAAIIQLISTYGRAPLYCSQLE